MMKILPVLFALSIVSQSLACGTSKKNATSRVKREGPSVGDMIVQGAGMAVGMVQQGAAIKGEWKVKSGNENEKQTKNKIEFIVKTILFMTR